MMDPNDGEMESIIRLASETEDECSFSEEHEVNKETEHKDEAEQGTDSRKPVVGMEFDTSDAAYDFYNAYALRVGFGIRKSKSHKSRKDGSVIDRKFVCNKGEGSCYQESYLRENLRPALINWNR